MLDPEEFPHAEIHTPDPEAGFKPFINQIEDVAAPPPQQGPRPKSPEELKHLRRLLAMMVTRNERIQELAARYFNIDDLLDIGKRMIGTGLIGGKARSRNGLMVQILSGLITYLLLAIYCQEQHGEPVSIRRVRQLRNQIRNEAS